MSRLPIGPLVKFGVFALVTMLATTVLGLTIANSQSGDKTTYSARFTDVNGLLTGDEVRIAGVVVGAVDKIQIVDRRLAQVDFSVDSSLRVPASAIAAVLYKNLIGQRFLSLGQGAGATGATLAAGDTIPVEHTKPPLNLTTLFNGFKPLFTALDPQQVNQLSMQIVQTLQGEGGTVQSLLASTASLTSTVADKDQVIGQVIDNLNGVLGTIDQHDQQLDDLIVSLQQLVSGLSEDRRPIGDAIASIGELTDVTAGFLADARPPLKDDIAALGALSSNLDAAKPTIEHFLAFTPYKLNKISRAGSYGSWFQFYLCGLSGSIGVGDLVPAQELPVFQADAPRCGPNPDGVEGQSSPLLPSLPPGVDQLVSGQAPAGAPDLPLFGSLPTGGN
ncbi:MAG TPA: MCE family protein [Pseudonocardia sp.]|jgi:phospholipid/cholesterol/gamma-HCH transport system substrate-binding protein|nr:MCE family protein [Pseudonocardia sp.]